MAKQNGYRNLRLLKEYTFFGTKLKMNILQFALGLTVSPITNNSMKDFVFNFMELYCPRKLLLVNSTLNAAMYFAHPDAVLKKSEFNFFRL